MTRCDPDGGDWLTQSSLRSDERFTSPDSVFQIPGFGVPLQRITQHRQKSAPIGVLLAVFGGTFGLHRFHLGDARAGWLDVLLCWTGLPTLAGVVEAFAMPRRVRIYEAERSGEEAERVRWLTKRLGGWAARGFPQMLKLWREADTIDRTFLALGLVLGVPVVLAAALYALAVIAYLAGAILGPWLYR